MSDLVSSLRIHPSCAPRTSSSGVASRYRWPGTTLLVLAIAAMACSGRSCPVASSESAAQRTDSEHPDAVVALKDWGLRSIRDIGFVSVGLVTAGEPVASLAVYDIRKQAPTQSPPDAVLWRSAAPILEEGAYVVSHFSGGNYNRLGGTFGALEIAPSQSRVDLRPGEGLHMHWERAPEGVAGLWLHLFDDRVRPAERTYLHTGAARFLYFEIRGNAGGERLTLGVADRLWAEKGRALPIGEVAMFLPEGQITREWQVARVPLSALPRGIEQEELASLSVSVDTPGTGDIFIRNLALIAAETTQVPRGEDQRVTPRNLERAMWVRDTESLLRDASERARLAQLCAAESIDAVFLQLIPAEPGRQHEMDLSPMLPLVEALHQQGLRVEALVGAPEPVHKSHHSRLVARVNAVMASNARNRPARRFDGIRVGNEFYRSPGLVGPGKESMLRAYLDGLDKAHELTASAGLPLAADIPFWLDEHDRLGEPIARLDGRPVSEHVMDRVGSIAIMAHRTRLYGPNGIIANVVDELEYAELTGKDVIVGIENRRLPDEAMQEFTPDARAGDILLVRPAAKGQLRLTWFSQQRAADARALLAQSPGGRLLRARFQDFAPADTRSFHEGSRQAMNAVIQAAAAELGVNSSLRGFALHDFESLR